MSLQSTVHESLAAAFREPDEDDTRSGIVTEWALTCEIAGNDGEIWLHTLRSEGSTAWKVLGMLEAHAGDLRAALLRGNDDD